MRRALSTVASWFRSVIHRNRIESDMEEELRFHIDSHAQHLQAQGIPAAEAQRQAHLVFGAIEASKEECRQSLGLRLWDELRSDLRGGFRVLRYSPVFTSVAVLSLALGIGANTAIFTLANDVMLRSMNVPVAARLQMFTWAAAPEKQLGPRWGNFDRNDRGETVGTPFPYPLYRGMQAHNRVMQDLVGFHDVDGLSINTALQAGTVDAVLVSGNFFEALQIRMEAGRSITPADDSESANLVAVISDAYWASRFHRAPEALGRVIEINAIPATIVGISAPGFEGPRSGSHTQVYLPLSAQQRVLPRPNGPLQNRSDFWWVVVMGPLKPGISDRTATAELTLAFRNAFLATMPNKRAADIPRFTLESGARGLDVQKQLRRPVFILLAVALVVLLIACTNLANLLLARASMRQREIGLRIAMGAGRARIVRQLLTESLLLATLGGAAGLLLAYTARNLIPQLMETSWRPSPLEAYMNWRVFAFAALTTFVTAMLFGISPALLSTRTALNPLLKETKHTATTRSRAIFSKGLVVFQVALSVVLVVIAGLFLRTFSNLRTTATGIDPDRLTLFEIRPPQVVYSEQQRILLFRRISENLSTIAGVQQVTASSEPLLAGNANDDCFHPTGQVPTPATQTRMHVNYVGPEFFQTYGIPLLSGHGLGLQESQPLPHVAVINQQLAQAFFPHINPLGRRISPCGNPKFEPFQVIGISADAKYSALRENPPPTIYIPYSQADNLFSMTFAVKTATPLATLLPRLRNAVGSIDKALPLLEVRTQNQQIDATLWQERVFASLTTGFGLLALLLASIGIYGVMSYTISRRTNELGIRMALGAQARKIISMVLLETALVTCLGIGVGILAAYSATRSLASLLFGLTATDPLTFFAGAFLMLLIALLAALLPAWRAATVDPMTALRHE